MYLPFGQPNASSNRHPSTSSNSGATPRLENQDSNIDPNLTSNDRLFRQGSGEGEEDEEDEEQEEGQEQEQEQEHGS